MPYIAVYTYRGLIAGIVTSDNLGETIKKYIEAQKGL